MLLRSQFELNLRLQNKGFRGFRIRSHFGKNSYIPEITYAFITPGTNT